MLAIAAVLFASPLLWDGSEGSVGEEFSEDGIAYAVVSESPCEVSVTRVAGTGVVVIPSAVVRDGIQYSVSSMGCDAVNGHEGLTRLVLPDSMISIDADAFRGCVSLSSISFGDSVCTGTESMTISGKGFAIVLDEAFLTQFSGRRFDATFGLQRIDLLPVAVRELSGWSPVFLFHVDCTGDAPEHPVTASLTSFEGKKSVDVINSDPQGSYTIPPSTRNPDGSISFTLEERYFFISSGSIDLIPHSDLITVVLVLFGVSVSSFFIIVRYMKRREGGL